MAQDIIIAARIEADSSGANQSVDSFRSQLRKATEDTITLSEKFGATSEQAQAAAKKVADLKDAIGDAKQLAETFNPDKKFVAFGQAVNGVISGFAGLQGAMGLFGVQSKDVEQTLLKVQSAMALQQGISGVFQSNDAFKLMAGTIKTQVVAAFTTLRGAIIATGIGALAVGVGLLIANFDKVKTAVLNLFPGLGKLASFIGDLVQGFTDFVGITSEASRALDELEASVNASNRALDSQIKILQAQGNKEKEVYELKKQRIENERQLILQRNKDFDKASDEDRARLVELNTDLAVLDATETARQQKVHDERVKNKEAADDKAEQDLAKQRQKAKDDEQAKLSAWMQYVESIRIQGEKARANAEDPNKLSDAAIADFEKMQDADNEFTHNSIVNANKRTEGKEKETISYIEAIQITSNAISGLADLVGRQTAAGKVLAIAQATMDTFVGANKALASAPPPWNFVAMAGVIAAGIANVKQIASTKVPGTSGGGSIPNIQTSAPSIAPRPANSSTQLDADAINNRGNAAAPIQTFVVAELVSSEQQRIAMINRAARIK